MWSLRWVAIALLVAACADSTLARKSPNADIIEEHYVYGPEAGQYSSDVLEDARLDVVSTQYHHHLNFSPCCPTAEDLLLRVAGK